MKTIEKTVQLCPFCMEEHELRLVETEDVTIFKKDKVTYPARMYVCDRCDESFEDKHLLKKNDIAMKDAYRKKNDLLTSDEIFNVRNRYGISQKDLAKVLGWSEATIGRYETHQVQDKAHDEILRNIYNDPDWFMELLEKNASALTEKAYKKYKKKTKQALNKAEQKYLRNFLNSVHTSDNDDDFHGAVDFNVDKLIDVINYYANHVKYLFTVRLNKLLWYADSLHYKKHGKGITGMQYIKMQMGAGPDKYQAFSQLEDVKTKESLTEEGTMGVQFIRNESYDILYLEPSEIEVLDVVVRCFGHKSTHETIEMMHAEQAFKKTNFGKRISYRHAEKLKCFDESDQVSYPKE